MILLLVVPLVTLHGAYATSEAACGEAPLSAATDHSAFCQRLGRWQVALKDGDEWFVGELPVQDGVEPVGVEGTPPLYKVRFRQHAFHAGGVDTDGEWLWPCVGANCAPQAVPIELRDRSAGSQVDVSADVILRRDGYDVVFSKLLILGDSTRAGEWRSLVEMLRGHHPL